jgi:hypothetical protein
MHLYPIAKANCHCVSGLVKMMYRVVAVIGGALALAACSSSDFSLDALKPAPSVDTVRFESEPPGAEAKTSNGQTCRTPCALALPVEAPLTVTFTLNGYLPESETIEPTIQTGSPPTLRPNPVMVELTVAPPQPKSAAKPARKPAAKPAAKPVAKKPAAKPAAQQSSAPAPAPQPAAAAAAPWPAPPKQ